MQNRIFYLLQRYEKKLIYAIGNANIDKIQITDNKLFRHNPNNEDEVWTRQNAE